MRKISCIVVDDEPLAAGLIESYVRKTPQLEHKGTFTSARLAFNYLQDNRTDLVFCDIQMPNLSGVELSRMLPRDTRIVFTTAFSDYALEGFKVHALDYLLKPVSYDDFLSAVVHAQEFFKDSGEPAAKTSTEGIRSIFVKTEYRLQQIDLDRITFIEGLKDYVKIRLDDGSAPVLSLMRMKNLEEMLPPGRFVRVHRSFIVQVSKISAIERNHILVGEERIPIGDTYQDSLYSTLSGISLLAK